MAEPSNGDSSSVDGLAFSKAEPVIHSAAHPHNNEQKATLAAAADPTDSSYIDPNGVTKAEPTVSANDEILDDRPKLRSTSLQLPSDIRLQRPSPNDVVVISLGSYAIRYGFASDSTPRRVLPAVAFPRQTPAPDPLDNKNNNDSNDNAGNESPTPKSNPICVPQERPRDSDVLEHARAEFDETTAEIEADLALGERRRGGGRPIPWRVAVEPVQDSAWNSDEWLSASTRGQNLAVDSVTNTVTKTDSTTTLPKHTNPTAPVIGREVLRIRADPQRAPLYDIVFPIWDGKLLFDCGASPSLIRYALETLFDYIVTQLLRDSAHARRKRRARKIPSDGIATGPSGNANGTTNASIKKENENGDDDEETTPLSKKDKLAKCFVTVVVPETSNRRDVAEIIGCIFSTKSLQAAAVFVHQSTVSSALGAGLATCAVVDIGHSATTVACVEDGMICGESRIHLKYGSYHVQKALDMFLHVNSNLHSVITSDYKHYSKETEPYLRDEEASFISKLTEQTGGFNVDENDAMMVTTVKAPSGRSCKVSLGVGVRTVPCFGLIYPRLLKCAYELRTHQLAIPARGPFEKNSEDDNFVSDIFNDLRRSGIATAAVPIGLFANDPGQPAEMTVHSETASIIDAIIWSVARAVEIKRPDQQTRTPDHYRRYLNAILLAGGGASIDGIALALEGRIKKGFQDAGVNISDVTVIDGGKGKGDEELAAAAAVLKDVDSEGGLIDDTDTASLPWKGGAVMVEADVVNEYWIFRDEWEARNVRALRERAPFYW